MPASYSCLLGLLVLIAAPAIADEAHRLPDAPGLGLEMSEAGIAKYRVA